MQGGNIDGDATQRQTVEVDGAAGAAGDERVALGIDIGGTKVAAVLMDDSGRVLARERGLVAPENNATALASILGVTDRLLEAAARDPRLMSRLGLPRDAHPLRQPRHRHQPPFYGRLAGIGAGAPGGVDRQRGILTGATNLGWRDLPLAQALAERYGCDVVVENDVNAAAWGERCFGHTITSTRQAAGEGVGHEERLDHLVFITVGTGIGAGVIEAGRIVRGRGGAGEIGHIPLLENGVVCKCGMSGCLEAVAAGPAFAAAGRAAALRGEAPRLLALAGGSADAITAAHIVAAAREGEAPARQLLEREGYYLALACLIASRMIDPQRIVIGGGLSEAGAPLFEAIWAHARRLRPRGPDPATSILPSALGADAGAIGAAALILR